MNRHTMDLAERPTPRVQRPIDLEALEVLGLLSRGLTVERVSRELDISPRTVRRRVRACCHCLGVETMIEAIVMAARLDLI